MERYRHRRLEPIPRRRIDAAIAQLPASIRPDSAHADVTDLAIGAAVLAAAAGVILIGAMAAVMVDGALSSIIH